MDQSLQLPAVPLSDKADAFSGRFISEGEQMLDKGKFIVIWKQEGGQWKLYRDIFNSSLASK